ncbi:MAG: cytochrome c [Methylobacteriaceae bacterium]|nr:cytochrome c [Methylobacteriaceae bacterium]
MVAARPEGGSSRPDARKVFWVVNHGIRMTGMPAFAGVASDDELWSLAAFVKKLPDVSDAVQGVDRTACPHRAPSPAAPAEAPESNNYARKSVSDARRIFAGSSSQRGSSPAALFVIVGLAFDLQTYGDSSIFSYMP